MKLFCALLALMVTFQQSHATGAGATGDKVTAAKVIGTAIDGGGKLADLMKMLSDMFLKPITAQVDAEIKRVNTDISGVTSEEKKMVKDAKVYLYTSRFDLTRTRKVLLLLATESNARSDSLIKTLKIVLKKGAVPKELRKGIDVIVAKMKKLLDRSKVLLKEAKAQYQSVATKLTMVKVKLELFATRVIQLGNTHGRRYREYAKEQRTVVYASAAACMIFPPTCPIVYAACAAALETKLKKYRHKVARLKSKTDASGAAATKLVTKCTHDLEVLTSEAVQIEQWESKVKLAYDEFLQGDYIDNAIEIDQFLKDDSINKLVALKMRCWAVEVQWVISQAHKG